MSKNPDVNLKQKPKTVETFSFVETTFLIHILDSINEEHYYDNENLLIEDILLDYGTATSKEFKLIKDENIPNIRRKIEKVGKL